MENTSKMTIQTMKQSWADPQITILSVKDSTLGGALPGSDTGVNDYLS